jgi:hypothetical protein
MDDLSMIEKSFLQHITCGDYCRNLAPEKQRFFVLKEIKEYYKNQKNFLTINYGVEMTKRYLVSADWWR